MDPVNVGPSVAVDPAGNVVGNVPCRHCGYELRGLNYSGRCPECGTAVGQSIYGNLLRFSDPQWVDNLARGVNLILWGIVATIVGLFVVIIFRRRDPLLSQLIGFVGGLVGVAGTWLLTEPDPGTREDPQTLSARRLVRFAVLVGVIHSLMSMLGRWGIHPLLANLLDVVIFVAAVVAVIGEFAKLYYLEKIAVRIPNPKLEARARLVRWGFGIPLAALMVIGGLMRVVMGSMGPRPGSGALPVIVTLGCISAVAGLTLLGFGIVYLIMLFQFNGALKEQSDYARRTWGMINAPASIPPPPVAERV